uniref:Sucrose 1F-fructosyltransferase (Fragments) n=1 Tax=Helianthus tuberosus TaxID=4233 RepID=Q7M232_HELTU
TYHFQPDDFRDPSTLWLGPDGEYFYASKTFYDQHKTNLIQWPIEETEHLR